MSANQKKISQLEERVLKDCSRQVLNQKCIPTTLGLLLAGEVLHKRGIIKLGRIGRILGASFFGFVVVRIGNELTGGSCLRRVIREVPDGVIAQRFKNEYIHRSGKPDYEFQSNPIPDTATEERRPTGELDDRFRPSLDNNYGQSGSGTESSSESPRNTTYAELREKHQQRMQREKQISQNNVPRPSWNPVDKPRYTENQPQSVWDTPQDLPNQKGKRNKYGDVWDE